MDNDFVVHRSKGITTLFNMQDQLIPAKLRQAKEKTNNDSKADERGEQETPLIKLIHILLLIFHTILCFCMFFSPLFRSRRHPSSYRTQSQATFPQAVRAIGKINEDRALPVGFLLIARANNLISLSHFYHENFLHTHRSCTPASLSYLMFFFFSPFALQVVAPEEIPSVKTHS